MKMNDEQEYAAEDAVKRRDFFLIGINRAAGGFAAFGCLL
jgi:hypothetical protein